MFACCWVNFGGITPPVRGTLRVKFKVGTSVVVVRTAAQTFMTGLFESCMQLCVGWYSTMSWTGKPPPLLSNVVVVPSEVVTCTTKEEIEVVDENVVLNP
jgi:hypothetical protein